MSDGLTLMAAVGTPGAYQRTLHRKTDGTLVLKEGGRVLATVRRDVVVDLAIAICAGEQRAATQPGALLALATYLLALEVRHEANLPPTPAPADPSNQSQRP
ncbi:hypothetical protein [Ancylobacter terrae]|uniref:hypothetical protein n=1 Tax=Ancylobacter sp. sgz301288 TaxID=3342077 RepID=UPI00385D07EA